METPKANIHRYVLPASTVYADELQSYNTISEGRRYIHKHPALV